MSLDDLADLDLLRAYVRERSQAAFAALVGRHVNLVYSVALRQVRSPQLAEEVAQLVFVDLARQAARLRPDTHVAAWLHTASRRAAIDVVRRESRRQAHEACAATEIHADAMNPPPSAEWSELEPLLDEAVEALSAPDRTAVLLRFFENRNFREIGAHLGISDDAAQKRVSRAVDQLRTVFLRRGVIVTAAGLSSQLSAHVLQVAPAGLGAAISAVAALSGTAVGQATLAGAGTTLVMTTTQKVLLAVATAAVVALGVRQAVTLRRQETQIAQLQNLSAGWQREIQRLAGERAAAASRAASIPTAEAATSDSADPFDARLRALTARVSQLKQLLDQSPAEQIPELRFLEERDWFGTALRYPEVGAGADHRAAFAALRNMAKQKFLRRMEQALNAHLEQSKGILPTDTTQLARHFDPPLADTAILRRYEMLASGPVGAVAKATNLLRERVAPAINPAHDNLGGLSGYGTTMGAVPGMGVEPPATTENAALRQAAERAMRAYELAHNGGDIPNFEEIDKLIPYFENREDGVKFAAQTKQAMAHWMPSTLNNALNDARRAYSITHHGATVADPMELASYFQNPMDGARYLDFLARRPSVK